MLVRCSRILVSYLVFRVMFAKLAYTRILSMSSYCWSRELGRGRRVWRGFYEHSYDPMCGQGTQRLGALLIQYVRVSEDRICWAKGS